jgi:hypothetical protein
MGLWRTKAQVDKRGEERQLDEPQCDAPDLNAGVWSGDTAK